MNGQVTIKNLGMFVVVVGAILGLLAFAGYSPYLKTTTVVQNQALGAAAPAGVTFSTQRYAAINWSMSNSTSTSLYNGDSSDRWVTRLQYQCSPVGTSVTAYTGAPLASLTLKAATSSVSHASDTSTSNTTVGNTNLAISTTVATSSSIQIVATSTTDSILGGTPPFEIWASGSYLAFFTNATNTASCTMGVQYIGA